MNRIMVNTDKKNIKKKGALMPVTKEDENILKVIVVSGCLIEKDGRYLLVQEKKPSVYGLWNLPAGKVEVGQTFEETAIREAKEETGFDVKLIQKNGIYHKDGDQSVRHVFDAEIIGGELDFPEDEILDAKWFTYDEILELRNQNKVRGGWFIEAIEKYRDQS